MLVHLNLLLPVHNWNYLHFGSFSHQNQGRGLMNYENRKQTLIYYNFRDKTFDDVIETVSAMNAVVDRLYHSAQKLT